MLGIIPREIRKLRIRTLVKSKSNQEHILEFPRLTTNNYSNEKSTISITFYIVCEQYNG